MSQPLTVLTWPDYALPRLASLARERLGLDIEWVLFDRNEEAYGLVTGDSSGFDVIFADGLWPQRYLEAGVIVPFEPQQLSGTEQLDPLFRERCFDFWAAGRGEIAAYPAYWGVRGLLIDSDTLGTADSWETLWTAPAGSAWVNSQGTELVAEVALANGCHVEDVYALGEEALADVAARLDTLTPRLGGIWRQLPELIMAFQAGALVSEVHSTSLLDNVRSATGRRLIATVPYEGSIAWVDGAMISAKTADPAAALDFVDLMLSAEGVRIQWEASDGYWSTNAAAMKHIVEDQRFRHKAELAAAVMPCFASCALYQTPRDPTRYEEVWNRVLRQSGAMPGSDSEASERLRGRENRLVTTWGTR